MIEFRRKWAPLIFVATYSLALLVPALMPSVQAKGALPPLGAVSMTDNLAGLDGNDMNTAMGPSEEVMAALHEQASAALRELQASSTQP
jgi:hypothetical protein